MTPLGEADKLAIILAARVNDETAWMHCSKPKLCLTGTDTEATGALVPSAEEAQPKGMKKKRGRKPGPKAKLANASPALAAMSAANFCSVLELDTEFTLPAFASGSSAEVSKLSSWACPAGRLRLLARKQAWESTKAAQGASASGKIDKQLLSALDAEQQERVAHDAMQPADKTAGIGAADSIARARGLLAEFEDLHARIVRC